MHFKALFKHFYFPQCKIALSRAKIDNCFHISTAQNEVHITSKEQQLFYCNFEGFSFFDIRKNTNLFPFKFLILQPFQVNIFLPGFGVDVVPMHSRL